jgi:endonuclease/exonuclease/phosphatase family metal-dependent hydrolase
MPGTGGAGRSVSVAAAAVLAVGLGAVLALTRGTPPPPADATGRAAPAGEVTLAPATATAVRPTLPRASSLSVLQLNLCNSGFALDCYAGGAAVPEAAEVIVSTRPDVVTLNEICRHDLDLLVPAIRKAAPGDRPYWAFQPAYTDRGSPYPCKNGDQFGNAIVGHLPAREAATNVRGGRYPMQVDGRIDEQRTWQCISVAGRYYTCTTHLTAHARTVALAQCRYLMNTAVPTAWAAMGGRAPTLVAGDLNLTDRGTPDVRNCVPTGWSRAGDGVQHVLATDDVTFVATRRIAMRHTDHPAWLATVRTL